jgi:stearoyl-CoA desaturase (Delta-9 desaturase)
MWRTNILYRSLRAGNLPEQRFQNPPPPHSHLIDEVFCGWTGTLLWGASYVGIYMIFATHWWMFLAIPIHWLMGPIHGAIVNWAGHKVGYKNFDNGDNSKNTLIFDFLTMGELFQNNHHKFGMSPNFAAKWFEIDPTYQIMKVLNAVGIIDMSGAQVIKSTARPKKVAAPVVAPPIVGIAPSPMDGE